MIRDAGFSGFQPEMQADEVAEHPGDQRRDTAAGRRSRAARCGSARITGVGYIDSDGPKSPAKTMRRMKAKYWLEQRAAEPEGVGERRAQRVDLRRVHVGALRRDLGRASPRSDRPARGAARRRGRSARTSPRASQTSDAHGDEAERAASRPALRSPRGSRGRAAPGTARSAASGTRRRPRRCRPAAAGSAGPSSRCASRAPGS